MRGHFKAAAASGDLRLRVVAPGYGVIGVKVTDIVDRNVFGNAAIHKQFNIDVGVDIAASTIGIHGAG